MDTPDVHIHYRLLL